MTQHRRSVSFLASVTSESEGCLCASLGADIIDAKDPDAGALGALAVERVRAIRAAVPRRVPVSATVGDPMDDADRTAQAVRFMAQSGADIVKIGFWPDMGREAIVRRLGELELGRVRLVAVLLADRGLDLRLVAPLSEAGFVGIMLDTYDKRSGALPQLIAADALAQFVNVVHAAGMFAGLAGALRAAHVPQLLTVKPDVLGFRGGLCRDGARAGAIDAEAVRKVRAAIPCRDAPLAETCSVALRDAMARL